MFHLSLGNLHDRFGIVGNGETNSPPRVKLLENGISKWTGAIFDILDVFLSLPEGERSAQNVKASITVTYMEHSCSHYIF